MFHISTKDPPSVDDPQKYSKDFLAFLRSCLQKLPPMRYSARDLMTVLKKKKIKEHAMKKKSKFCRENSENRRRKEKGKKDG